VQERRGEDQRAARDRPIELAAEFGETQLAAPVLLVRIEVEAELKLAVCGDGPLAIIVDAAGHVAHRRTAAAARPDLAQAIEQAGRIVVRRVRRRPSDHVQEGFAACKRSTKRSDDRIQSPTLTLANGALSMVAQRTDEISSF